MPGGSVNGRPFRESSDSYSRTGIPCGNPKRYKSHDVVRMEAGQRSRPGPIDGPLEKIETEGQKQLQAMLDRQMETKVTIQQQLERKREFSRGSEYQSSTSDLVGTRSLGDYLGHGEVNDYIEEMMSYGLTHDEILFKLQMENKDSMTKKSKLSNPEYSEAKLMEINEKIDRKKQLLSEPDKFSNVKPLSRHEMELENAISTANPQNKFLHKTLIKAGRDQHRTDPNDPMNNLPEILDNLTQQESGISSSRKNKKDKRYKGECSLECCNPTSVPYCAKCHENKSDNSNSVVCASHDICDQSQKSCDQSQTSCDCDHNIEVPTCAEKPPDCVSKKVIQKKEKKIPQKSTCFTVNTSKSHKLKHSNSDNLCMDIPISTKDSSENKTVIENTEDNEEMRVFENVEVIPEEVIRQYKLSPNEVKQIPRFETYTPGEPSNVLFVKNLSAKVTEEDLASLFIRFQDDNNNRIVFKLLNGRMKGQAFVTFNSEIVAGKALELVHGYDFKGKPIIVQYGKKVG